MKKIILLSGLMSILILACRKEEELSEEVKVEETNMETQIDIFEILPDTFGVPKQSIEFKYVGFEDSNIFSISVDTLMIGAREYSFYENGKLKLVQNLSMEFLGPIEPSSGSNQISLFIKLEFNGECPQNDSLNDRIIGDWSFLDPETRFTDFYKNCNVFMYGSDCNIIKNKELNILSQRRVFNQGKQLCEIVFEYDSEMYYTGNYGYYYEFRSTQGGGEKFYSVQIRNGLFKLIIE